VQGGAPRKLDLLQKKGEGGGGRGVGGGAGEGKKGENAEKKAGDKKVDRAVPSRKRRKGNTVNRENAPLCRKRKGVTLRGGAVGEEGGRRQHVSVNQGGEADRIYRWYRPGGDVGTNR